MIVTDSATVAELERSKNKWSMLDYLCAYSRKGNPNYIEVKEVCDKCHISISSGAAILAGRCVQGSHINSSFKWGTYQVTPAGRQMAAGISAIINATRDLGKGPNLRVAKSSKYVGAVAKMVFLPEFFPEQYIQKMQVASFLVVPQADIQHYMGMVEHIYNRSSRNPVSLVVEANAAAKSRSPVLSKVPMTK
jgi:hypothetical protein